MSSASTAADPTSVVVVGDPAVARAVRAAAEEAPISASVLLKTDHDVVVQHLCDREPGIDCVFASVRAGGLTLLDALRDAGSDVSYVLVADDLAPDGRRQALEASVMDVLRHPDDDRRDLFVRRAANVLELVSRRSASERRGPTVAPRWLVSVVTTVVDAICGAETRQDLEVRLCDGLVAIDSIGLAVLGRLDAAGETFEFRAVSGTPDGYPASDPWQSVSTTDEPTVVAARDRRLVVESLGTPERTDDSWRGRATACGFETVVGIPSSTASSCSASSGSTGGKLGEEANSNRSSSASAT
ncbi:hypothetical protein VB773_13150 [Haloarculaceae archaeon H-GB2-1]|nr:hypothetical protein [Haloarculaceae archaeon H-GB2-1]